MNYSIFILFLQLPVVTTTLSDYQSEELSDDWYDNLDHGEQLKRESKQVTPAPAKTVTSATCYSACYKKCGPSYSNVEGLKHTGMQNIYIKIIKNILMYIYIYIYIHTYPYVLGLLTDKPILTVSCPGGFIRIPIYNKDVALTVLVVFYLTWIIYILARRWYRQRYTPYVGNNYEMQNTSDNSARLTSGSIISMRNSARRNRDWFEQYDLFLYFCFIFFIFFIFFIPCIFRCFVLGRQRG